MCDGGDIYEKGDKYTRVDVIESGGILIRH